MILKCDQCQKEFETNHCVNARKRKLFHFCSRECVDISQQKGGKLQIKNTERFQEKHGVSSPLLLFHVKKALKKTCFERWGVESPLQVPEFHKKGIEAAQTPEAREKARKSYQKHFGVDNPMQAEEVKETSRQTCLEKYGVPFPLQNSKVLLSSKKGRKKTQILQHWLTKENLTCTASYETAFVKWANANQVDFDWQIVQHMPDGRVYIIDAFIKSGDFANTWIEIKGWFPENRREKWEWFHANHPNNSELWNYKRLKGLGVL